MDGDYVPLPPLASQSAKAEGPEALREPSLKSASTDSIDHHEHDHELVTPLPKIQLSILLFLLLTEPVSAFVIYPFIAKVNHFI